MLSLVSLSSKFQMLIPEIRQYFLLKKMREAFAILLKKYEKISFSRFFFSTENISVFGFEVVQHLTS